MLFNLENVSVIYDIGKPTETYAIKNIDLSLRENKFYGILGPSGSGKSTLLYLLSGLKKASSGKILYEGRDYKDIADQKLSDIRNKDFGFIFQRHFLMEYLTVLQNVMVPLNSNRSEDLERGEQLLKALGLGKDLFKRPYQLSGGQRQRVAIARALINNPRVIFADELTASLDHDNAFEVMRILKTYQSSSTIILVTHDESILKEADEVIHVWDGTIRKSEERMVGL